MTADEAANEVVVDPRPQEIGRIVLTYAIANGMSHGDLAAALFWLQFALFTTQSSGKRKPTEADRKAACRAIASLVRDAEARVKRKDDA